MTNERGVSRGTKAEQRIATHSNMARTIDMDRAEVIEDGRAALAEARDMASAPKDRAIWAWEHTHGHEAKVIWHNGEWECLDMNGQLMGIGFYPTHWRPSEVLIRWEEMDFGGNV